MMRLEDVALLFQHASQMTHCHIAFMNNYDRFSMPPITHHMLKSLTVLSHDASAPLDFLTLPCLQKFSTNTMILLIDLPALVHRSSCPLTRLSLSGDFSAASAGSVFMNRVQPFSTVADLVVEGYIEHKYQAPLIQKLLLEEYFPNLRRLTLGLLPFRDLWDMGIIRQYLDRKRPRSDGFGHEGKLHTFLVVDPGRAPEFEDIWNSDVGEELREMGASLREDGFEFL
jgi:hypothetical protein